jgi:hypothetical protein
MRADIPKIGRQAASACLDLDGNNVEALFRDAGNTRHGFGRALR